MTSYKLNYLPNCMSTIVTWNGPDGALQRVNSSNFSFTSFFSLTAEETSCLLNSVEEFGSVMGRVKNHWNVLKLHLNFASHHDVPYTADLTTVSKRCFISKFAASKWANNFKTNFAQWIWFEIAHHIWADVCQKHGLGNVRHKMH